jgi:large subunit ribosomal protein L25
LRAETETLFVVGSGTGFAGPILDAHASGTSMAEVFHVKLRTETGTRHMRRLRNAGTVPAVLYGHGQPPVNLAIGDSEVKAMVRHGARVVDLEGAVAEKAFVRELQWDTFGNDVLHIDLTRVSADERVTLEVTVELRGMAECPGVREGGVVDHVGHSVEIECLVIAIPDKLILRLSSLTLDGHINADQIDLPEGAKLISEPDMVIATCAKPQELAEGGAGADGAEPEVIKKAKEEGAEGEE